METRGHGHCNWTCKSAHLPEHVACTCAKNCDHRLCHVTLLMIHLPVNNVSQPCIVEFSTEMKSEGIRRSKEQKRAPRGIPPSLANQLVRADYQALGSEYIIACLSRADIHLCVWTRHSHANQPRWLRAQVQVLSFHPDLLAHQHRDAQTVAACLEFSKPRGVHKN